MWIVKDTYELKTRKQNIYLQCILDTYFQLW